MNLSHAINLIVKMENLILGALNTEPAYVVFILWHEYEFGKVDIILLLYNFFLMNELK